MTGFIIGLAVGAAVCVVVYTIKSALGTYEGIMSNIDNMFKS